MTKISSMEEIVNKVAGSGIVTLDPETFVETGERVVFDLKPALFQELIVKEKEFRAFVKDHDWSAYSGKIVALTCSADAIVPTWAYMLVTLALEPFAKRIVHGNAQQVEDFLLTERLAQLDPEQYRDARIVIKGCSDKAVPLNVYVQLTKLLKPYARSIMFGEPCSTVPLYKAKTK